MNIKLVFQVKSRRVGAPPAVRVTYLHWAGTSFQLFFFFLKDSLVMKAEISPVCNSRSFKMCWNCTLSVLWQSVSQQQSSRCSCPLLLTMTLKGQNLSRSSPSFHLSSALLWSNGCFTLVKHNCWHVWTSHHVSPQTQQTAADSKF